MKKLVYLALGTLIAMSSVGCGGGDDNKNGGETPTKKDPTYVPPEQKTTEKIKLYAPCKPAATNPCEKGLVCAEIPFSGGSFCVQQCEKDDDCPTGALCATESNKLTEDLVGTCVEAIPTFGLCIEGSFAACSAGTVCTDWGFHGYGYYASYFYTDAGKDDIIPFFGMCSPLCDPDKPSCPTVNLRTDNDANFSYDIFGLSGTQLSCNDITSVLGAKNKIGICGLAATDGYLCNESNLLCAYAQGRKDLQAKDNINENQYIEREGRAMCDPSPAANFINALGGVKDTEVGDKIQGFDEFDRLLGYCWVFCSKHETCACDDAGSDDPACIAIKDDTKKFRDCFYLHLDGATDNSGIGGNCAVFTACESDADCKSGEKCIDPTEKQTRNNKQYSFPAGFTKKFCDQI